MEEQINFLLNIKFNSLKRCQLNYLNFKQFKQMVYQTKWLVEVPNSLSMIAKDIDSITAEDVIDYVVSDGKKLQDDIDKLNKKFEEEDYEKKQ
ncbi:MAG: hypothetical protein Q4C64_00375 [Erysipelotrichia bacterium]|nr:hypothetical protein [Erysipelotrichia bacterium]